MELYIVGLIDSDEEYRKWRLVGVFDDEQKALATCRTANHFVGSIDLNEDSGDVSQTIKDGRYPKRVRAL